MHHFFVTKDAVRGGHIYISGDDYHHAVRVLRVREGERIMVSDETGHDFLTEVVSFSVNANDADASRHPAGDILDLSIIAEYAEGRELPAEVTLFQCVLKGERMEWVIEKAVELGVSRIVPVKSRYTVVRLDPGRAAARTKRYQKIAESAARQSKRSIVPEVLAPVDFGAALSMMDECDLRLIPYECEEGMESAGSAARSILAFASSSVHSAPADAARSIATSSGTVIPVVATTELDADTASGPSAPADADRYTSAQTAYAGPAPADAGRDTTPGTALFADAASSPNAPAATVIAIPDDAPTVPAHGAAARYSIGIMIGPEGGFHPEEIALAREHAVAPISLGRRILRAETAALTALSAVMLLLELG